jgi:hypothetical protein
VVPAINYNLGGLAHARWPPYHNYNMTSQRPLAADNCVLCIPVYLQAYPQWLLSSGVCWHAVWQMVWCPMTSLPLLQYDVTEASGCW